MKLLKKNYVNIALTILAIIVVYMILNNNQRVMSVENAMNNVNIEPVKPQISMGEFPKKDKANPFNILEFDHSGKGDFVNQFDEKLDILEDAPCDISCPLSDYTCDSGNKCLSKKQKKIINNRGQNRTVEF